MTIKLLSQKRNTLVRYPMGRGFTFLLQRASVVVFVLLLAGCTFGAVEVQQEQASDLAGELLDGHNYGQTFTLEHDGLNRIDLYTATYARENTHPVALMICASPACQAGEELLRLELLPDRISNSGPTVITFPPLPGTAGKTLYFSIESPGSVPGDAITVYREQGDVYSGGQMYVDGEPTNGDIAFIAYTQESFTLRDIWSDFYSRASQDSPFFIFYCSILLSLLILLILGLVWSSRMRSAGESDEQ